VVLIREIRGLLYEQGFTIGGARQRLETDSKPEASAESKKQLIKELLTELEDIRTLLV